MRLWSAARSAVLRAPGDPPAQAARQPAHTHATYAGQYLKMSDVVCGI